MRAAATTRPARKGPHRELREAAALARAATHVVLFLGEPHAWSGESATLAEPRLPHIQRRLVQRGAPGQPAGEAHRLRHRRPGAAHSAGGGGGRRRHLLDGAPRQLRGRRHRRHPRRGLQPDRAALARAADRRRDHLRLRHAAGADRPAAGAGGGGLRGPAPAPSLVRLLPRPRRPLAGGLLLRRGLFLHRLRALRLVARQPHALGLGRHARHRQRPGDQHRKPRRHRDGASLLPGHGVRGAGPAAPGTPRPPAGDARSRRVGDARPSRSRPRCSPSTAAIPRPARGSGPTGTRRRTPTGCSSSSTKDRRSTPSSASARRRACSRSPWCRRGGDDGRPRRSGTDDLGVSSRRPEQHGQPRRCRRLRPMAGRGALRDAGGPADRAGGRRSGPPTATPGRSSSRNASPRTSSRPGRATASSSSPARSAGRASGTTAGTRATISTTTSWR